MKKKLRADVSILFDKESATFGGIEADELARWQTAYPKANIGAEIRRAAEWAKANPPKRNWRRFLVNWFMRAERHGDANIGREMGRHNAAGTFGI